MAFASATDSASVAEALWPVIAEVREQRWHDTLVSRRSALTDADVEQLAKDAGAEHGLDVECFQSNHEGALVDAIHDARGKAIGIVINAGAYTHTSVAIRDAISAVQLPAVEVHITNVHAREEFRHHSYLSDISKAVIAGAGVLGYRFAVEYLADLNSAKA